MLKSFRLIAIFSIIFTSSICVTAQDDVKFKDVLLNGKPAKLNVLTGEVTLAKPLKKSSVTNIDSVKVISLPVTIQEPKIETPLNESDNSTNLNSDFYTVKEGDNLFKISIKFQTSLTNLKKANSLETTLIKKGQKLRIRNLDVENEIPSIWVVKKGDNLYQIAIKTGTTVESIKKINGLTSNVIKIGQKLHLK